MNLENLNLLITHMETMNPALFDMSDWLRNDSLDGNEGLPKFAFIPQVIHACGTVACIAGNMLIAKFKGDTEAVIETKIGRRNSIVYTDDIARELLGLDYESANDLFFADSASRPIHEITHDDALRVLYHLRDTGEVDWSVIN